MVTGEEMGGLPALNQKLLAPSLQVFARRVGEIEEAVTELEYYNFWERDGKPSANGRAGSMSALVKENLERKKD